MSYTPSVVWWSLVCLGNFERFIGGEALEPGARARRKLSEAWLCLGQDGIALISFEAWPSLG